MVLRDDHQADTAEEPVQRGSRTRDVLYGIGGLLIGLLVLGGVWLQARRSDAPFPAVNEVQPYAAPAFTANTLDGVPVSLSDFNGQIVLLNFWASWCQPCKEETPDLEAVYRRFRDQGLVIVGVDLLNTEASLQDVQAFIKQYGVTYPVVLDERGEISKAFAISPLPTTYFIDRQGRVRYIRVGKLDAADMERVFRRLQAEGM
jgi:peroxiredoxin